MNLGYFAADTLGVTLYQTKEGLTAKEVHTLTVGPWDLELPIDVSSDVSSGREFGFWVTLNKTLRCYLIVRERESWFFVLDAAKMEKCAAKTGFVGQTTKERVLEFKPAIKGLFRWSGVSWQQIQFTTVGTPEGRLQ